MLPELTPELIDQIIFGMENQSENVLFDTETGELCAEHDLPEDADRDRYVPLPEWSSLHGYQLMERFVRSLRNPIVRESLREALSRGKGVFRNFKNVLRERQDIERLWYSFKEKEMKAVVKEWYNHIREIKGLEQLDFEPEDTLSMEELVLSDFSVREAEEGDIEEFQKQDQQAFHEALPNIPSEFVDKLYRQYRSTNTLGLGECSFVYKAVTPAENPVGFIWGVDEPAGIPKEGETFTGSIYSRILQLYIDEAYRGLGLAKVLIKHYLACACRRNVKKTLVELFGNSNVLQDFLVTNGFSMFSQQLMLDMNLWYEENIDNL